MWSALSVWLAVSCIASPACATLMKVVMQCRRLHSLLLCNARAGASVGLHWACCTLLRLSRRQGPARTPAHLELCCGALAASRPHTMTSCLHHSHIIHAHSP